mmetsp:Transcript_109587/g.244693  ORF Transcript_109587/g.244693 Transcript_109587/m.244693 type:complete len:342 (-) Transcript_109587:38-1063(-)
MVETPLAYKVLAYPKLSMRLELGAVYTRVELEARCGRNNAARRTLLHKKLEDRKLFKVVPLNSALQPLPAQQGKRKAQPDWVRPPAIRRRMSAQKDAPAALTLDAFENDEVGRQRLVADGLAAQQLEMAGGDGISDKAVLTVLRAWGFYPNGQRGNVIPQGQEWVYSDTLGLIRCRDGRVALTQLSKRYPSFTKLLTRWFHSNRPPNLPSDFPVTSISVNSNYCARRHRDKHNAGPSAIRAFGRFSGGSLLYWPKDRGSGSVEELARKQAVELSVKKKTCLFHGKRAHEVMPFHGRERFSLVFFTCGKYDAAPQKNKEACVDLGFCWPTKDSLQRAEQLVA